MLQTVLACSVMLTPALCEDLLKTKGNVNKHHWFTISRKQTSCLVKMCPSFCVTPGGSLPCLQDAFAGPYPASDDYSSNTRTNLLLMLSVCTPRRRVTVERSSSEWFLHKTYLILTLTAVGPTPRSASNLACEISGSEQSACS